MKRGFLKNVPRKVSRAKPLTAGNHDTSRLSSSTETKQAQIDCIEDECIDYGLLYSMNENEMDMKKALNKKPHDTLDIGDDELLLTTQPPQSKAVVLEGQPDGWTECLLTGAVKKTVMKTPSFPKTISRPADLRHRFVKASTSDDAASPYPGLTATCNLDMGDLILSERPILIVPALMRAPEITEGPAGPLILHTTNERTMNRWNLMLQLCLDRMPLERQTAFWNLRDFQTAGKKTILGIVQTNGFKVVGLNDIEFGDHGAYSGVFETLSHLTHSCRPNVERYWDMASFSMQLRATRKIQAWEKLTVSFCNLLKPYTFRKEILSNMKIVCSCKSCKMPKISDMRRAYFPKATVSRDEFFAWIENARLPDDYLIKRCLVQMSLLEDEGMENSPYYESHISRIMHSYVALGDEESAKRWGEMLGKWQTVHYGPEAIVKYKKPSTYRDSVFWNKRLEAKVTYEANCTAETWSR